jgi:BR serine/threonine kinase
MTEKIGPFILGVTLGEGSTGKVKAAVHKDTGENVAIKIINKSILADNEKLKKKIEREIDIMKFMKVLFSIFLLTLEA